MVRQRFRRVWRQLPGLQWSQTGSHVFWSAVEAGVSGLLSCLSAFTIAWLIGPAELGIGAALIAVHVLLWVGVNALFADALVQRAELSDHTPDSALWASCCVGGFAALLQLAAAFGLMRALHDPRLIPMSVALALTLPLVGGAGAVQGMLTRGRAYRALAFRAVIGQGLGTIVGIAVAFAGLGAWALVSQQVCISAAGALSLLLRMPWRVRPVCRITDVRDLLRIGLPLTASTLVQQSRYRIFALLIGITAGPAALGQVHLAFRLVDTVRDLLMTALWRLLLPVMAPYQNDPPGLLACVDRCLARVGWVVFPLCAAMALAIQPLVGLLLGPVWAPAGRSAQWLVVLMAYVLLGFPGGVAGIARGQPKYALFTNLAALFTTLLAAVALRPATPLQAIAVWAVAQAITSPYGLAMNARLLQVGVLRPLRAGLPSLVASVVALLAGLALPAAFGASMGEASANAWLFVGRVLAGTLVFLPLALMAARWRGGMLRRAACLAGCATLAGTAPAEAQRLASYFPEGVPGYEAARGVTVLTRVRPLYDAPGIAAGGATYHPVWEEGIGYDSNVLGTTHPYGSLGVTTRPSLLVSSNGSHDSLAAYAGLDDIRMPNLPAQGQTNWTASLGGGADIGRDRFTLAAVHLSLHQAPTEIDALPSDTPVAYQVNDFRTSYSVNLPRGSITPDLSISQYTYDNTTILGVPSPQGYRNRNVARAGILYRHELAPGRNLIVVGRATQTDYLQPQPGNPSRNSTGYELLTGIDYDYDGIWRVRLLLGWEIRDFAAAQYAAHSSPIAEAGLIWTPTGLTTLTATLTQSIEDAAQEGYTGYTYTTARLRLDHEYLRNVLLHASAIAQRAVFTQGGGTQNGITLGAGVTWLMNRNLRLSTDYAFSAQQSAPTTQSSAQSAAQSSAGAYNSNVVLMTLRFAM